MNNFDINSLDKPQIHPNKRFSALMKAVIKEGNAFRFRAAGNSMNPFIKNGDIITISPINNRSIITGDILAVSIPTDNHLVVHRVVSRKKDLFLLKADNCKDPDGWIPSFHIIGSVNKIERKGYQIHLGLGLEKRLIAVLSRVNILKVSLWALLKIFPSSDRRFFI